MNFYQIALPLKIDQLYTYKTNFVTTKGCRVVVPFHNTIITGIVWAVDKDIDSKIKYREIYEIVDEQPLLTGNILKLAEWISRYYFCSIGKILAAMLPSAFNVQIQLEIRKTKTEKSLELDPDAEAVLSRIHTDNWLDITQLKKDLNVKGLYSLLENLEDQKLIEINRTFDQKIKKKFQNFIIINDIDELPKLTEKQQKCLTKIKSIGVEVALAKVASEFSYSIIKSLRNKGILRLESREVKKTFRFNKDNINTVKINLTTEQKEVVNRIEFFIGKSQFKTFLLHGITGSGKTEVYIRSIKKVLNSGKTALMLVPEISLTPQMVGRLLGVFGDNIAILHSHLNDREKWEEWKKISKGESSIVVGARSAIFAPLKNIGVIIVDEEHETSYKQESAPRYNGRDLAVLRAQFESCICILGSATPSLESWNNVIKEKFEKLELRNRPSTSILPEVKIIDLKKEEDSKSYFSKYLLKKMEDTLSKGEQIILFQNRRGHSSFVQCVSCGEVFNCKNCDISMNYHSYSQELVCHYCGNKQAMPRKCPKCGSYHFIFGSPGTQQIETSLKILFPEAVIKRMDSDSTQKKDSYDNMYQRMHSGDIDILLGTQMIAKGLDFHNVTLVGVISADISLNIPDFRAAERTFQLLTQVAGRSGRGLKSGEVIIQTYNPDHYSIGYALDHDFLNFSVEELNLRKELKYPPIWKLARLVFSHKQEEQIEKSLKKNNSLWLEIGRAFCDDVILMGPLPAPLPKIQGLYRYHLIIKASSYDVLNKSLRYIKENIRLLSTIKFVIDVDPLSLL